jgi:hypothetical protein
MKRLRRITEAEVIAEFIKAEFYHPEYDSDRHKFEAIVNAPDLMNETDNAIRRALLFRRRATMWYELPQDVQWWEVQFEEKDFEKVNVFPRAQWRRISNGNFQALNVADRIRQQLNQGRGGDLLSKIHLVRSRLQYEGPKSMIILIGVDENRPVTLLEGNHRFVSSLLLPREIMLRRLNLVCGFSPYMHKCCWYKTDLPNLLHYTKSRIKHLWSRDADVNRIMAQAGKSGNSGTYANAVSYPNAEAVSYPNVEPK